MDDVQVPAPNPFITAWAVGAECRALVYERAEIAQALFRETAGRHARTGREIAETRVETLIDLDRWASHLLVMVPYAASEIFGTGDHPASTGRHRQAASHDLNTVLDLMAKL